MKRVNRFSFFLLVLVIMAQNHLALASRVEHFDDRVNLALRQVAHHLLLIREDSTSNIPPVQNLGDGNFVLHMADGMKYDRLPALMKQAFQDYDIQTPYEVFVKNCQPGTLILGFNAAAVARDTVPCVGREYEAACVDVFIWFDQSTTVQPEPASPLPWVLIPVLLGLGLLYYRRLQQPTVPKQTEEASSGSTLPLGQFTFNPELFTLSISDKTHTLTYRENKLLHLFAQSPNEVLERADIMARVWEDEGVVVGRSLDVFVSRLRKYLKADPSVQIKSVHGIGYRLEIQPGQE